MKKLNLPQFDIKIQESKGKIEVFDALRKKYIILTPEEWVRQHFVNMLISHFKYPKSLISLESGLKYNELQKRSDILVYDRGGKPFLLVECKSADVALSEATFKQLSVYNVTIRSPYVAITNGLNNFCCKIDHEKGSYEFLKDLPAFGEF